MKPRKISLLFGYFSSILCLMAFLVFPAEAQVLPPPLPITANSNDFVRVEGDHFLYRGQRWYPNGMNYFPLYVLDPGGVLTPGYWFDPARYNAHASDVDADLALISSLGMNMVAVGIPSVEPPADNWQTFINFLDKCRAKNLKVFLFIPIADPSSYSYDPVKIARLLTDPTLNLPNRPEIFAYDLAWEPNMGNQEDRSRWNSVFSRWIASTYGSVREASGRLGFAIPEYLEGDQTGFIKYTMPLTVPAGQPFSGTVTVKNMGNTTWHRDEQGTGENKIWPVRLGIKNVPDYISRVILPRDVPPYRNDPNLGVVDIQVSFPPPPGPGRYRYFLGMVHERVRWFGDLDIEVEVTAAGTTMGENKTINLPTPVVGPSDNQLRNDGNWKPFVQAYRRAIDAEISRRYGEVVRLFKTYAPSQLVSAREGYGGTGAAWAVSLYPFDLASTAAHFDFLCPEGYQTQSIDNKFEINNDYIRSGVATTTAYARWASGGKPVVWAEFGYDLLNPLNPPVDLPDGQHVNMKQYFSFFLDAMLDSGGDGSIAWWYPGGARVDSTKSDMGFVNNPDRTRRPVCEVYTDESRKPKLISSRDSRPDALPAHNFSLLGKVMGYVDIYQGARDKALAAMNAGKRFVMQPEGTGTNSDSDPAYIGLAHWAGPTRDLWAEMSRVELKIGANGEWFTVMPGGFYTVRENTPVYVKALVRNLGPATWVTGTYPVKFAVNENLSSPQFSSPLFRRPISVPIPRMGEFNVSETILTQGLTQDADVQFQMVAEGRTWIDGALPIKLIPVGGNGPCSNSCTIGAVQCASQNAYQTCGDWNRDGCTEWGQTQTCPAGQVCQGGRCVAACQSTCQIDARRCASGNEYQLCGDPNGDGCLEWGQSQTCATGQVCQEGQCITPSQCRSGEALIGGQCSPMALLKAKKGTDMSPSSLPCPTGYQLAGSWLTGIGMHDGQPRGHGFETPAIDSGVMWLCSANIERVRTVIAYNDADGSSQSCEGGQIQGVWHMGDGHGTQIAGSDSRGIQIKSGWLGLCVSSGAGARAEVEYSDSGCGSATGCGPWLKVGDWKPDPGSLECQNGRPKAPIGSGASGGLISAGWMGICVDAR